MRFLIAKQDLLDTLLYPDSGPRRTADIGAYLKGPADQYEITAADVFGDDHVEIRVEIRGDGE